ncbi:MAG TPA: tetratricopeptide repeat protein, partial [Tepidisphaeraceae bacterium]
ASAQPAPAANPADKPAVKNDAASEEAKMEFKARDLLNRGMELLDQKQDERGIKMISSVVEMFPKSKVRFKAFLAMGKHFIDVGQYDLAIKQYEHLNDSENPDEQAEGLYQTGISYYKLNSYDKAFMTLRRVTNEYPWSVFANESYYYIGQCHFKLGRWGKAIEALQMVGTSVPSDVKGETLAEAGQRLYVKVFDKDLVVLRSNNQKQTVTVTTEHGDKETLTMEPLGKSGEYFIQSIQTVPGEAVVGDGQLQILGREKISVDYDDQNTESGKLNVKRLAQVQMVSTASVGFTDGAYKEYTHGVFADQDSFIRVKDIDCDTTKDADSVRVRVATEYKVEHEQSENGGVDLEQEAEFAQRDSMELNLTETEAHSGIFAGKITTHLVADQAEVNPSDNVLSGMKGDNVVVTYVDDANITGKPREVKYKAKLLVGQIQDVKIIHYEVNSEDLKARKNLIEARISLKLGNIFKEVGLSSKANEKAQEGLEKVDEVINRSLKASLDRKIVEDAFSVKWDLLLVQDKLQQAIDVCQALTQLFPDSTLVDRALLKIGQAKMDSETPGDALGILSAVIRLPKSELKAEAQFAIGETLEKVAQIDAEKSTRPLNLANAMMAYKSCADNYPQSPYAGDALDKIANYYIGTKDYARAVELMDRVMTDYPDAQFLDKMLLKWVIASYRMNNFPVAKTKAEQLLAEYPNSKSAEKARGFLDIINKKMGGGEGGGGNTGGGEAPKTGGGEEKTQG